MSLVIYIGPPHVVVSPSTFLVHDSGEQLDIACSAYFTQSSNTLRWFSDGRPMGQGSTGEASRHIKSYVTVKDAFDGKEVKHYTCRGRNSFGLVRNATVMVVERRKEKPLLERVVTD